MATIYVKGPTGSAPHPVTGRANECGADTGTAGNDSTGTGTALAPYATLDGSLIKNVLVAGDVVELEGRIRLSSIANLFALDMAEFSGGITIRQKPGGEPAILRGTFLPGGTLANNLTESATYWTNPSAGSAWEITCDGTNGKPDLRSVSIGTVVNDYDEPTAIDADGRRWSHLTPYQANGVTVIGAWAATGIGLGVGVGQASKYVKGDSVVESTNTYVCQVAHTTSGTFSTDLAGGKWILFTDQRDALIADDGSLGWRWIINHQTGLLVVVFPFFAAPSNATANGIEVAPKGRTGLYFYSVGGTNISDGVTLDGLTFQLWGHASDVAPYGTGWNISHSRNASVVNCRHEDCGDHWGAFGGYVHNANCTNCWFSGGATGIVGLVYNDSSGTHAASGTLSNSDFLLHSYLNSSGVPVDRSGSILGTYVHAAYNGVRVSACTWIGYAPPDSSSPDRCGPIDADQNTSLVPAPADLSRVAGYPLIVDRCTSRNMVAIGNVGGTKPYIGFIQTRLGFELSLWNTQALTIARQSPTGAFCFEACDIIDSNNNGAGATYMATFACGANFKIYGLNSTIYNNAASHSNHHQGFFCPTGNGAEFHWKGGILAWKTKDRTMGVVVRDDAFTCTLDLDSNLYVNITTDAWSEAAANNSDLEWAANVDLHTRNNGTTNPFSDVTGASLAPTTAAKALTGPITPHVVSGINGLPYGGQYGAWQAGGGGGPLLNRPRRAVRAVR